MNFIALAVLKKNTFYNNLTNPYFITFPFIQQIISKSKNFIIKMKLKLFHIYISIIRERCSIIPQPIVLSKESIADVKTLICFV